MQHFWKHWGNSWKEHTDFSSNYSRKKVNFVKNQSLMMNLMLTKVKKLFNPSVDWNPLARFVKPSLMKAQVFVALDNCSASVRFTTIIEFFAESRCSFFSFLSQLAREGYSVRCVEDRRHGTTCLTIQVLTFLVLQV